MIAGCFAFKRIKNDLKRVVRLLGKPGAGLRVAEKIKEMLDYKK